MNQLTEKILTEIRKQGAISFARFMECALYCPVYGYYEKEEDIIGRRGDFFTSVSVGPLFGELLALQFAAWLEPLIEEGPVQIVEAGAHDGRLAADILTWLRSYKPAWFGNIGYWIVEPSDRRKHRQRLTLSDFVDQTRWVPGFSELLDCAQDIGKGVRGVVFSNELLDSLPVHRLGWDARQRTWFEWGVALCGERLTWARLKTSSLVSDPEVSVPDWPNELLDSLPNEYTIEASPAAVRLWSEAAKILLHGKLMTIDYGLTSEELVSPERPNGTLRGYNGHQPSADVLANPGEQDITAHVNFSALCRAGEAAGLKTEELLSQEQFLTRVATPVFKGETPFGEWTAERTRQFQTLTHPGHLGRSFRVLIQSR